MKGLYFKCNFYREGCNKIINYLEYFSHLNNCKYNNNIYECQVEKYKKSKKIFEKCLFKGNIRIIFLRINFFIHKINIINIIMKNINLNR